MLLNSNFDINCILVSNPIHIQHSNAFGYAIEFGTIAMIKHLVQNGCMPNIIDNNVLARCNNINIFQYIISVYSDSIDNHIINLLNCLFHRNMPKSRSSDIHYKDKQIIRIKKINIILEGNCIDINELNNYINDQFGCHKVETIQLLEQYGIIFNWPKLLHSACYHDNTDLIVYILDKNVEPSLETLQWVFNSVNKEIIALFVKYKINLSSLSSTNSSNIKNNYNEFANQLEECGLDKNDFISYLMASNPTYYSWKYDRYEPDFNIKHD